MIKNNQVLKEFAKYVSANVIAMIGLSCYILADTFFVSLKLGETGLAALNLSAPSFNMIFALGMLFAVGGGAKMAMCKGAGDDHGANKVFTHTVLITSVFAALFLVLGLTLAGPIATMLGAEGATYDDSKTYVQVILCFAPFFMFSNVFQNFVRNDNAPRLAMIASLAGNLFNIVFDYVLVFPCNMDMLGAALATGFSPIVSLLIISLHFLRKKNTFKFEKTKLSLTVYGQICTLGLSTFIGELTAAVVLLVFNTLFKKLGGDTAVAAYAIIINIFYVTNAIYNGISQGTQPMISFSYGESNHAKIKQVIRYALITTGVVAIIEYVALFFGANGIVSIFNSENGEQLQQMATLGVRLYFISVLFSGFNQLFSAYFTASNKGLYAQLITLLKGLITIIPIVYLFAYLWGMTGMWTATPVADCLTLACALAMYFATKPKKHELIPHDAYHQEFAKIQA